MRSDSIGQWVEISAGVTALTPGSLIFWIARDFPNGKEAQMTEHHDNSHNLAMFIGVGVALGAGIGAAFGTAMGNIPIGVGIGPAVGVAVAVAVWSARQSD